MDNSLKELGKWSDKALNEQFKMLSVDGSIDKKEIVKMFKISMLEGLIWYSRTTGRFMYWDKGTKKRMLI